VKTGQPLNDLRLTDIDWRVFQRHLVVIRKLGELIDPLRRGDDGQGAMTSAERSFENL
jgi:hypothetical protein